MINPYMILGAFAAFILATSGAYVAGRRDGQKLEAGVEATIAAAIEESARITSERAAEAISQIEVKNTTINRKTERVIEQTPAIAACPAVPDSLLSATNEALTGADAPADRELPAPDPDGSGNVP